ncbi:MAG: DUF5060 domain-containing protein [Microcoleaceae cyanobacterium]
MKEWHRIDLTFDGPETSETDSENPFLDYRLDVTFSNDETTYVVPGYYAADGNAGETSADSGNKWRVHFAPDEVGTWTYDVSFRQGDNVAIDDNPLAGAATDLDGISGSFDVEATDKTGKDFRGLGRLEYVGEHYLQFAETGDYFIKGGADSPENFLGYFEFDNTFDNGGQGNDLPDGLHRYEPHIQDWNAGDPTWQDGKGKGIIGAVNYLASEDMNSIYFLTHNLKGDGREVFPWTNPNERLRFDVSKLDQWEVVFDHMDKQGIQLHVVTQEQENDQDLDGGELGTERKLYYRELVARFGHHLAVNWNLGEENTNTDEQRKDFASYIRGLDPYDHQIVSHTFPNSQDSVYEPLLGFEDFEGTSLQTNNTHQRTKTWIDQSAASGRPWIVTLDEIGPASTGVKPDADDPTHDSVRKQHLWGNLMAGGAGVEWYFGYSFPHSDLDAEDWRTRDVMWDQTRYALEFFQDYLPFTEMRHMDDITAVNDDYVFGKTGDIYAVYLPDGGTTNIDLPDGDYTVQWYNPRTGGDLLTGTVEDLLGGDSVSIGQAPAETSEDWVALIQNNDFSAVQADLLLGNSESLNLTSVDEIQPLELVGNIDSGLEETNADFIGNPLLSGGSSDNSLDASQLGIDESFLSV